MNKSKRRFKVVAFAIAFVVPAAAQLKGKPDLIVMEIRVTGSPSLSGDHYIVPVSIGTANRGRANAGPFKLSVMKALEAPPGAEAEVPFSGPGAIAALAARGKLNVTGNATIAPRSESGKKIRIRAFADSLAQVGESDERNNASPWLEIQLPLEIKQPSMSAKLVEPRPDLTLTSADINIYPSSHLAGGDNIGVQANVRNPGTAAAASVKVGVRVLELRGRAEVLVSETVIPSIAARGSELASFSLSSRQFGMGGYILQVRLDEDGTVLEASESNNTGEKTFVVRGPELSLNSSEVQIGPFREMFHDFSFSIPVHNNGDGEARHVLVEWEVVNEDGSRLWYSPETYIERIPAGGWRTFRGERSIGELHVGGTYNLIITVTPNCREPDRTDNRIQKMFTL